MTSKPFTNCFGDSWVQEMIDLISKGPADLVN